MKLFLWERDDTFTDNKRPGLCATPSRKYLRAILKTVICKLSGNI